MNKLELIETLREETDLTKSEFYALSFANHIQFVSSPKTDGVVKSPIYCVVVFLQTLGILHVWPRS
jgi:hypothetical protein